MTSSELTLNGLLEQISALPRGPFSPAEILDRAGWSRTMRRPLLNQLDTLVALGLLRRSRRGSYLLVRPLQRLEGQLQRRGNALQLAGTDGQLYALAPHQSLAALSGDQVNALLLPQRQRRRAEVLLVDILRHQQTEVVGRCQAGPGVTGCWLLADSDGQRYQLQLPPDSAPKDLVDQVVQARIQRYPTFDSPGLAKLIATLGAADDPWTDLPRIALAHQLPLQFDAAALAEAQAAASQPVIAELAQRTDLRYLPLVTIDGADARDFDDAIALEAQPGGYWRLWVAIADVSHYVASGSALDAAAWQRGTSVYFPGSCLPMLPEALSNGICSLMPQQDRLALVLQLDCDGQGGLRQTRVHNALICSRARLTYEAVQHCLDNATSDGAAGLDETVAAMLPQLAVFCDQLRQRRLQRGALDFDLPEADIRLDDNGRVRFVGRRPRLLAHRLVEECMLLANEAVAALLTDDENTGALYRVHEAPDAQALIDFQQFIALYNLGFNLDPLRPDGRELAEVLRQAAATPQAFSIHRLLLRSMRQASYSADNVGHFGLASACYGHFTSPIRRYPDLVQHRLLKRHLGWTTTAVAPAALEPVGLHCTQCERRAMEAEREVVALRSCQFMQDRIGERFSGFVSAVTDFGFFVELDDFFIEGLVSVRHLSDDYYQYDVQTHSLTGQRRRRRFTLGQAVEVVLWQVRLEGREIDFVLADLVPRPTPQPSRRRLSRGKQG